MKKKILNRLKELKLYFIGFIIITVLYTFFSILVLLNTEILSIFPIRADFLGYLLMGLIISIFGFRFGFKKFSGKKRDKVDAGLFYGMLFFISSMQIAVCIFDNIGILIRVYGPEQLNLDLPMEIQFIFIYFLTISQYRFFTIIYLVSGLISILYIRKRSTLLLAIWFTTYIYSSLFLGYILQMPIGIPYLNFSHLLTYIILNLILGMLFLIVFFVFRFKLDKSFD